MIDARGHIRQQFGCIGQAFLPVLAHYLNPTVALNRSTAENGNNEEI